MGNSSRKSSVSDLALFGGDSAYSQPVHVGQPNIGDQAVFNNYVDQIFESRWLSNNGPLVQKFEKKIEKLLGVRNCIAMCNGTIALELAIRALGIKGEVVTPSFTFIATTHAIYSEGATPVFADINPTTHTIDCDKIESQITAKTSAIIGVHVWGQMCEHRKIQKIAAAHNLKVIYDAAHAFLCSDGTKMSGNFGDAEVLSFHATKFCNSFEGGAVVTNNDSLAQELRLMRNFGFCGRDEVIHHGTNGKMSEISAAMGLVSLESVNRFIDINKRNYERYHENLSSIDGIKFIEYDTRNNNNFQYITLEVRENEFGLSRDALLNVLTKENILARRYFYPGCHNMEPYKTLFPNTEKKLPVTTKICGDVLVLPTGSSITLDDIDIICALISFVSENTNDISRRL